MALICNTSPSKSDPNIDETSGCTAIVLSLLLLKLFISKTTWEEGKLEGIRVANITSPIFKYNNDDFFNFT